MNAACARGTGSSDSRHLERLALQLIYITGSSNSGAYIKVSNEILLY